MSIPALEEIVAHFMEPAKKTLVADKYLTPCVVCIGGANIWPIPVTAEQMDHKVAFYRAIGSTCKQYGCCVVVLINDCAMKSCPKGVDPEEWWSDPTERPTTYPKSMRTDLIMVGAMDLINKKKAFAVQPYREEDGKIVFFDLKAPVDSFESGLFDCVEEGYDCVPSRS